MTDFLWHKVYESERKKIEEEAKDLILEFGDVLEKLPAREEVSVERNSDSRGEGFGKKCDDDFRALMFSNAPRVKDDCIVAEKGKWVKKMAVDSS